MANRVFGSQANLSLSSLEGYLLVAAPHWQDDIFGRTVCLVVYHSQDGAVGIVLNRGFQLDADGLWKHLSGGEYDLRSDLLHFGGPKSGPVVALHNCDQWAEFQTGEGVYLAAQIQNLQSLVKTSLAQPSQSCDLKIIVGQADWQTGQLESELLQGCWLPIPISADIVFEHQHLMWQHAMVHVGNQFVSAITGAKPTPDALLN